MHFGNEEARIVVAHDHTSFAGERFDQPATGTWLWLDVWVVDDALVAEVLPMCAHPIEDETVKPIAGPWIAGSQRLDDDQGPFEGSSALGCVLQREVPSRSTERHHPVKHVPAIGQRMAVEGADANLRNPAHRASARMPQQVCLLISLASRASTEGA